MRVGQTIECVDPLYGVVRFGERYVVEHLDRHGNVLLVGMGGVFSPFRFRAVEPSLIDPAKWLTYRVASIRTQSPSHWPASEALTAWCLVNSAAVLLGALVAALLVVPRSARRAIDFDYDEPARTWADYPLWSVWRDEHGTVRIVDYFCTWPEERGGPEVNAVVVCVGTGTELRRGDMALWALPEMASWVRVDGTPKAQE